MTYVCLKDGKYRVFDISETEKSNLEIKLDDIFETSFEVDDMIAAPVALLNEKGYVTDVSCAAHYHDRLRVDVFTFDEKPSTCLWETEDNGIYNCCYEETINPQKSFVRFFDEYAFKTLPDGWKIEGGNYIYYEYPKRISEYDFYEMQIAALKALWNWVKELPSNK